METVEETVEAASETSRTCEATWVEVCSAEGMNISQKNVEPFEAAVEVTDI